MSDEQEPVQSPETSETEETVEDTSEEAVEDTDEPVEDAEVVEETLMVNPTDYIYGFMTWLSESPNRVYRIGGAETQTHHHTALAIYCKENNLPDLSDGWLDKIKLPPHNF